MQTSDDGLLFQTDAQISDSARRQRKIKATAVIGRPISLSSKILGLVVEGCNAWTAESGWQARWVDVDSGSTRKLYRGHSGPVTCVAVSEQKGKRWLFTGSWDKTIRVWDADSGACHSILIGHTDFVKSLTIIPGPALITTSSDRTVRLWNISGLGQAERPQCVQIIREHTRPIDCAACKTDAGGQHIVWTGDSLGAIKQWIYDAEASRLRFDKDMRSHQTSVTQLRSCVAGVWSASMDGTAVLHSVSGATEIELKEDTYIRAILPLDFAEGTEQYVLTGSDDENIRVWDIEGKSPVVVATVQGHAAQISDLAVAVHGSDWQIVSVSLDATLRRWTMPDLLHPKEIEEVKEGAADGTGMTAEEARELEELLSESE